MESLSCTSVSDEVHDWYRDILRQESEDDRGEDYQCPRAAEIVVPDAAEDYEGFTTTGMKKAMLTNLHVHGFSCEKTSKGRYMLSLIHI